MNRLTITKVNESFLEIQGELDILNEIYSRYSEHKAGYLYSMAFKDRRWDGKKHFFNTRNGMLPYGFLPDLLAYCKKNCYEYDLQGVDETKLTRTLDEAKYKESIDYFMRNSGMTIRPYQDDAVKAGLTHKRGILLSCTGSGKSLMIYNIVRALRKENYKHILIIVPTIPLIYQMRDDMIDYGYDDYENELTIQGDGNKEDETKPVLISTWESLQHKETDYFEKFDAVIVDETHGARAMKLFNILEFCVNAKVKLGCTGTLPTDPLEQMTIQANLGNVIYELKSHELIEQGVLSPITIANLFVKYPLEFVMQNKSRSYPEEVKIVESFERRYNVLDYIISHRNKNNNILILVHHVQHLKDTTAWLKNKYPDRKIESISGAVKGSVRNDIRKNLNEEDGTILVATYQTCSTGVNIPKLHDVILFANSKSKIVVLQTIGRGLRKHHSKNKVVLFDIIDDLSYKTRTGKTIDNYCIKHWRERQAYYEGEHFKTVEQVYDLAANK
jgi:superfamily II DNA or RNA helicase